MASLEDRIQVSRQQRRRSDRVTLLQLSDLHFTSETRTESADQEHFLSHFEKVLLAHLEKQGTAIDLVVVTGDLIDNASDGDDRETSLVACSKYLYGLCSRLGLAEPAESLIVIPGNHDYRWTGLKHDAFAKARFRAEFSGHLGHRLFPNLDLFVGAFDSNVATESVEWARGWVDTRTFSRIQVESKSLIASDQEAFRYARRIALVHHHPMPVPTAEERQQGFLERIIGKKMGGAVEHMLLKNSGTFLLHALDFGFQAVFHGHFHRPSFWRTVADTSEGSRAVEIFGSRSLGSAAEGNYGFNLITLYNENDLAVLPFSYTAQGLGESSRMRPRPVGSASYEEVQASRWRPGRLEVKGKASTSFASKDHQIKWDVHLPSGKLVTRELIRDFEVQSGSFDELSFQRKSVALTREEFKAWLIEDGKRTPLVVETSEGETGQSGALRIIHTVHFPIALTPENTPINLELLRDTPGVMFTDLTDAEAWGYQDEWDSCIRTVKIPTRHLSIRLSVDAVDTVAPWVSPRVLEPGSDTTGSDTTARRELDSERVNVVSWDRRESSTVANWDMSVRLPLAGHRYGFRYRIPSARLENEKDERARLENEKDERTLDLRTRFWDRTTSGERQAVLDEAKDLLVAFLEKWRMPSTAAECALLGWVDGDLRREARGQLLADYEPRWGRDIAGGAFRAGLPIRFTRNVRSDRSHSQALARVPASARAMIASPLGQFDETTKRYRTILILVYASAARNDGLARITSLDSRAKKLDLELRDLWNGMLRIPPYVDL